MLHRFLAAVALLAMLGCPTEQAPAPEDTCDASGGREHWALTSLEFVRLNDDGTSDGFDLDNNVSATGGFGGCGVGDMVSVDGREGIDNAMGRLLPVLETTEFVGVEEIFAELVSTGELILIAEIAGAEDFANDECVTVAMRRAAGEPLFDTSGAIMPDQTMDLDQSFQGAEIPNVPIVDSSVEARPFQVVLPISFLDANFDLTVYGGAVRYDVAEDGTLSGVFAGGLDIAWLIQLTRETGINDEIGELLESVMGSAADLAPDETGACTQLSVTLKFSAVPIYVFEDALE